MHIPIANCVIQKHVKIEPDSLIEKWAFEAEALAEFMTVNIIESQQQ